MLAPFVGRGRSAADVDGQNRGRILIEDDAVATSAEPEAVTACKRLDVALACHGVAMKRAFHLFARVSG